MTFLDLSPGDVEYFHRMDKEFFLRIVPKMFEHKGRQNKNFVKLLQERILILKYPTIHDVLKHSGYADSTIATRTSALNQLMYFTDGTLNKMFHRDYNIKWAEMYDLKESMSVSVVDSSALDNIEINSLFSYKDIFNVIKNNRDIKFLFPEDIKSSDLDYQSNSIQYVQFNHIGTNKSIPYQINFYYKCTRCSGVQRYEEQPKHLKCPLADCGGTLVREVDKDLVTRVHASQVSVAGEYIPAISLVEIPNGEFTAAMLMCRDSKNSTYYVFIISVKERKYECAQLELTNDRHAVWQLIDTIDNIHESRMGFHIAGMEYYKAGILMSVIANATGFTSYNVLIAGKPGGAKTSTARWYYNTVSLMCKLQDVVSVSIPGLVGSSSVINVNNRNIQINEPGLLARNEFVVLDELYSSIDNKLISKLKVSLSSPTISKEVAGNRSEMTKTACVTATANIVPAVYNKSRKRFNEYLDMYLADPHSYYSINEFTEEAMNDNFLDDDASEIVARTVQLECASDGFNWIDGQSFADLDRFALLFYVGNPVIADKAGVPNHIFDNVDLETSTPDLQRSIYSQNVRDYIKYCSRIKVVINDDIRKRVEDLIQEIWDNDYIHSKSRGMLYVKKTLDMSAMLCGRDHLTDMDFDFVRELFKKTGRWVEVEDLRYNINDKDSSHEVDEPVPDLFEIANNDVVETLCYNDPKEKVEPGEVFNFVNKKLSDGKVLSKDDLNKACEEHGIYIGDLNDALAKLKSSSEISDLGGGLIRKT